MADDTENEARNPWSLPAQWLREEKFWRDIGTRVLAGVITAAIVYLGALVLGYLHTPEIGVGVTIVLTAAVVALLLAGAGALFAGLRARSREGRPLAGRVAGAVLLVVLAVALVAAVANDLLTPAA
ncbi:hypothetical protein ACEXQD_03035 [Herbiconiux sp. P15]|uniref:hypothetical protein n=1 Tax=Herbiconiux liukaitaii TaxID=3342799 RepID=UPI0035B77FCF